MNTKIIVKNKNKVIFQISFDGEVEVRTVTTEKGDE